MCRENELPVLQEWFCRCLLHHGLSIKGGEKEHTGPILSVDCTRSVLSTTSPGTAVPAVLEEHLHVLPCPLREQVCLYISKHCRPLGLIWLTRNILWSQCSTQRIPSVAEVMLSNLCKEVGTICILYPFVRPECVFVQLCLCVNACQTWSCIAELISLMLKDIYKDICSSLLVMWHIITIEMENIVKSQSLCIIYDHVCNCG